MDACSCIPRSKSRDRKESTISLTSDVEDSMQEAVAPIKFLTSKDRRHILHTWAKITDVQALGQAIYLKVFAGDPEMKSLFSFGNVPPAMLSEDEVFQNQASMFGKFIEKLIETVRLNDSVKLNTLCVWAGKRHSQISFMTFRPEWWSLFNDCLFDTFLQSYSFNKTAIVSWRKLMDHSVQIMEKSFNTAHKEREAREKAEQIRASSISEERKQKKSSGGGRRGLRSRTRGSESPSARAVSAAAMVLVNPSRNAMTVSDREDANGSTESDSPSVQLMKKKKKLFARAQSVPSKASNLTNESGTSGNPSSENTPSPTRIDRQTSQRKKLIPKKQLSTDTP